MSENVSPVVSGYLQAREKANPQVASAPVSRRTQATNSKYLNPQQPLSDVYTPSNKPKTDWKPYIVMSGILAAGLLAVGMICRPTKVAEALAQVFGKSGSKVDSDDAVKKLVFQNLGQDSKVRGLNELSGLDDLKGIAQDIKLAIGNSKLLKDWDLDNVSSRYLLYGPPGTGKTTISKAIAKELNADFVEISKTDFNSKYVGAPAQKLVNMFDQITAHAQQNPNKPVVVLMDEIDSIIATDTSDLAAHSEEVLNVFKTRTLELEKKCPNVFIFGTTNKSISGSATDNQHIQINSAIIDRFKEACIHVERPDAKSIEGALRYNLSKSEKTKNLFNKDEYRVISEAFKDMDLSYREIDAVCKRIKKLGFVNDATGKGMKPLDLKKEILSYLNEGGSDKKVYFDDYLGQAKDTVKVNNAITRITNLFNA